MNWLPRFALVGVTGPGVDDDDDHHGRALMIQWGQWIVMVEILKRASG